MNNELKESELTETEIKKIEIVEKLPAFELTELTADQFKNEINEEQRNAPNQSPPPNSESGSSDGNSTANDSGFAANSGDNSQQLSQQQQPGSKQAESASLARLITVVGDFIIPPAISIAAKKFFDKVIPAASLKAEKDEIKAIESAWNDYLLTANWQLTPEWKLAIALLGVYGAKAVMVSMDAEVYARPDKVKREKPLDASAMSDGNLPIAGQRLPNGRKATRKPGETRGRKPR